MLSSLPLLFPHDPHSLYYPTLTSPPPITHDPSSTSPFDQPPSQNLQQQQTQGYQQHQPQTLHGGHRSVLSALRADENAIVMRRANIRRFGAGWLKPPGVGKTLQGMADERAEREEGEILRAREFAAAEALAAAEAEALEAEGAQNPLTTGDPNAPTERDLDEDVPDADEAEAEIWSDDDDDINDLDDMDGLTGTNADTIAHDDFAADDADDAGGFAGGGDEGVFGAEMDLDAEVPDADDGEDYGEGGSYEHTDTEVEEESSEDGAANLPGVATRVGGTGAGGGGGAMIGASGLRRAGPTLGSWDVRTGEVVGRFNSGARYHSTSPAMGSALRGGRVGTPTTAGRNAPPTAAGARNRAPNLIPGNESSLLSSSILGSSSPVLVPERQGQRDRDTYLEELRLAQRRAQRRGG